MCFFIVLSAYHVHLFWLPRKTIFLNYYKLSIFCYSDTLYSFSLWIYASLLKRMQYW